MTAFVSTSAPLDAGPIFLAVTDRRSRARPSRPVEAQYVPSIASSTPVRSGRRVRTRPELEKESRNPRFVTGREPSIDHSYLGMVRLQAFRDENHTGIARLRTSFLTQFPNPFVTQNLRRPRSMSYRNSPFRFLKDQIQKDLREWHELRHRIPSLSRSMSLTFIQNAPISTWNEPIIDKLIGLAFDETEAWLRGCAWSKLSEVYDSIGDRETPRRQIARTLFERFSVAPSALTDQLVETWMAGILLIIAALNSEDLRSKCERDFYEEGGGARADEADWESTKENFVDADPAKRIRAIRVAADRIGDHSVFCSELMRLVDSDSHIGVRITALRRYIEWHANTGKRECLRFLGSVVRATEVPPNVREVAYQGLFEVVGVPPADWPVTRECLGQFAFPEDIDWPFVLQCDGGGNYPRAG